MAKSGKKKSAGRFGYLFIAIGFALIMGLNFFLVNWIFKKSNDTYTSISSTSKAINSANGQLQTINENFMEMIAQVGMLEQHNGAIDGLFPAVKAALDSYERLEGQDPLARRRFDHARAYISAYEQKIVAYQNQINLMESAPA
ncbi:MAG: hypothetical protein J5722_01220, partial [Oscillospiraceae bacterium]|nr:hypothetical protein [Oscillospiraceae bacterium]